jgi:hypothetical protein
MTTKKKYPPIPEGMQLIFRKWRRLPNGKIQHARQGSRGIPMLVPKVKV